MHLAIWVSTLLKFKRHIISSEQEFSDVDRMIEMLYEIHDCG